MGVIPRLRDDEDGCGPKGRGFIAHTDIPEGAEKAYPELLPLYGDTMASEAPPLSQ